MILGDWVCMTGLRRTAAGFVHDLSVKCDATAGIDRVEFALTVNGSPGATLTASARSMRFPNFSAQPSRMPGVSSGQAPFWGHGVGLDLSTVAAGTIVVQATIYEVGGASYTLPRTMVVYNDTDGGDRRPRAIDVFVHGTDGSDAANGLGWGTAVKSVGRALQIAASGGTEVGGARIWYRGIVSNVSGGIYTKIRTAGDWWCEHIADVANGGCYIGVDESSPIGLRQFATGDDGGTPSANTRHRWIGFDWHPDSCVAYVHAGVAHLWVDGGDMEALNYLGAGRWSVRYAYEGAGGTFFGINGPGSLLRYFSGVRSAGATLGFEVHKFLYDCVCEDFIGIAAKLGSAASQCVTGKLLMRRERYETRVVEGFVRMDPDAGQGNGRPPCTVTKPTGTTARITGPVGGYDFSIDAQALIGQSYYGLRFEGSGSTGLDTGVGLVVTAAGNTGGAPWVEVTAPGASAGSWAINVCSFYTARVATGMNYWNIHPDGIQIERNLSRDVIFDCALVDAPDLQSYFTSGNDVDLALIENLRDDGSGANAMNWFGADCTNSILQRLTITGQFQNSSTTWAGSIVRNCVFGSLGGDANQIVVRGATVSYCHFITGGTIGTNATSGAWFASSPSVSPFPYEPSSGNKGNGSPALVDPPAWAYSPSGSTRGVLSNVGDLDWSVPAEGLTAAGSVTVPISASGAAGVSIASTGNATVRIGASGASSLSVSATGGASVPVVAVGAASLQIASSGQAGVSVNAVGASTVGAVGITTTGSATVSVSAVGSAVLSAPPSIPAPPPQQAPRAPTRAPAPWSRRGSRFQWRPPWG